MLTQGLQQRAALLARIIAQFGVAAPGAAAAAVGLAAGPPLAPEEAAAVVAANERGRQGRARFAALRASRAARLRAGRPAAVVRIWRSGSGL